MSHQQSKFESSERLAEIKPEETLRKIGLSEEDVFCDIGAGSGIFTIPAAKITNNLVYALDINDSFLKIIENKAKEEGLTNVKTIKVTEGNYDIESGSVDFVILVTVLHEIKDKDAILSEIKRIMKNKGKLAVIEFHKQKTPMGPPASHRISKEEVTAACEKYGYSLAEDFDLGDNFYCIVMNAR